MAHRAANQLIGRFSAADVSIHIIEPNSKTRGRTLITILASGKGQRY